MKIASRALLLCLVLFSSPVSQAQSASLENDLQTILENYVGEDDPGVVVLVSTPDETQSAARGLADLEAQTPIKVDDHFRIGSITKTFVATLMLQLAEEELLELDHPIADYLPAEVSENIEYSDAITIRQLLNMTSGIPDYTQVDAFYEAVYNRPDYPWTALETVEYVYGMEASFAPGEGYEYSNTNYNLLQMIIEMVTDSTLGEQMQTRILEPLNMTESWLETPDKLGKNIVHGYYAGENGGFDDVTFLNEGAGLGDGGLITDVEDLAIFARTLFSGKLLAPESMEQMLDFVDDGEGGLYGLGVTSYEGDFGTEWGHSGATIGFQSSMSYLLDEDVVVIVFTNNFDSEVVGGIAYEAQEAAYNSLYEA
jgi:D-alanyl-D-alanine carboxypeptidase